MIKPISDMPDGTIGFRAHGAVTRDDYRDVLEPAMRAAAETGEIRMLYELAPGFELKAGAMLEDAKTGLGLDIGHHSAWKRTAVVTDADWVANAMDMFAWMAPGDVRVFRLSELETAKRWVAG
jgi:hypothetical protein